MTTMNGCVELYFLPKMCYYLKVNFFQEKWALQGLAHPPRKTFPFCWTILAMCVLTDSLFVFNANSINFTDLTLVNEDDSGDWWYIWVSSQCNGTFERANPTLLQKYLCGFNDSEGLSNDQMTPWIRKIVSFFWGGGL